MRNLDFGGPVFRSCEAVKSVGVVSQAFEQVEGGLLVSRFIGLKLGDDFDCDLSL